MSAKAFVLDIIGDRELRLLSLIPWVLQRKTRCPVGLNECTNTLRNPSVCETCL